MKKPKKKKCAVRGCQNTFWPRNSIQRACSVRCSLALVAQKNKKRAEVHRRKQRLAKEALRPLKWYREKAQQAFNTFVRERDRDLLCISCQRDHQGQYQCGHYMTTGSRSELRFHPANGHRQCTACNNHLSGNLILYRRNLIKKVGPEMVEYLETFNRPQRWTIEDLKEITQHYRAELKRIKNRGEKE